MGSILRPVSDDSRTSSNFGLEVFLSTISLPPCGQGNVS